MSSRSSSRTPSVLLVTAGETRRLTGGNVYDAHIVRAMRHAGFGVRVARADRAPLPRASVTIVDSIAFPFVGDVIDRIAGRVVALAHMPVRGRSAERVLERADRVVAVARDLCPLLRRGSDRCYAPRHRD